MSVFAVVVTSATWTLFAVEPTIGSALIAAVASIVNTALILWHDKRTARRQAERRLVLTKIGDGDDAPVVVTDEDRRSLADRRAEAESRKLRERRRRRRRD